MKSRRSEPSARRPGPRPEGKSDATPQGDARPATKKKDERGERAARPERGKARGPEGKGVRDRRGKGPGKPGISAKNTRPAGADRKNPVRRDERQAPPGPRAPAPQQQQKKRALRPPPDATGPQRSGTVALIGRPNVGKSTLLNAALQQPLAITSPMPQTTRDALLGVVHHGSAEIALLDTPGLHRPRTQLGRVMNASARDAARRADVVVFVTDVSPRVAGHRENAKGEFKETIRPLVPHPGDLVLLADLTGDRPAVLVLNKVDRVRDKQELFPLLEAYGKVRTFAAVVPVSARREDGVQRVLDEIAKLLPEGAFRYGPDDVTDKPTRYFAAEYVREQILRATEEEVPHATAVTVDRYVEPREKSAEEPTEPLAKRPAVQIDATIHVERPGQKKILIGAGGAMMKRIGIAARERIEELVGGKVVLRLWVCVTPDWRESLPRLEELGYGKNRDRAGDVTSEVVMIATRDEDADTDEDEETDEEAIDDGDEEELDDEALDGNEEER